MILVREATRCVALAVLTAAAALPHPVRAQQNDPAFQRVIEATLLAAPAGLRDAAEVRGWTGQGELVTLRHGSDDGLVCLADRPTDGHFSAVCYARSLEPFMARGRDLAGLEDPAREQARWADVEAGRLQMPEAPAMVHYLLVPDENVAPSTFDESRARRLRMLYIPRASAESTGVATWGRRGEPWLMWPGSPSARIVFPSEPGGE